ncbi:MAG: oligoribonuclease [Gammaproteobacteria bacterium]
MEYSKNNLVWIDLEMTGLRPEVDVIIEIATVVTNSDLSEQVCGPVVAIHQNPDVLAQMDEWNTSHHTASGLVSRVQQSEDTISDAETMTLQFLEKYVPINVSPMCGSSICQDRRFIYKYMPTLAEFFHYRNLDVSTIKELANRWADKLTPFEKDSKHMALEDIRDSIDELKYYRQYFLNTDVCH